LVGAGSAARKGFPVWDRGGRPLAICATFAGALFSTGFFFLHVTMFTHGPGHVMTGLLHQAAESKAIIHENDATFGFTYFPLIFRGVSAAQYYVMAPPLRLLRINQTNENGEIVPAQIISELDNYQELIVVDTRLRTYRDLRACWLGNQSCP